MHLQHFVQFRVCRVHAALVLYFVLPIYLRRYRIIEGIQGWAVVGLRVGFPLRIVPAALLLLLYEEHCCCCDCNDNGDLRKSRRRAGGTFTGTAVIYPPSQDYLVYMI